MLINELSKFCSFPSQQQVLMLPHVVSAHLNYLDSARSSLPTDKSWLAPNSREAHLTYRRRTEKKNRSVQTYWTSVLHSAVWEFPQTSNKRENKRLSSSLASNRKLTTQEAGLTKWKHCLNLSFAACLIPTADNLPNHKVSFPSTLVETTSNTVYPANLREKLRVVTVG